jgi:hypothetical protein
MGMPRATHDSPQAEIHDDFPVVNYQFQFPTHSVTITSTRDAHGGIYKHPNRMGYDCTAECVVYRLSKQRSFEISGTTHPTTQPHNPEYLWLFIEQIIQNT